MSPNRIIQTTNKNSLVRGHFESYNENEHIVVDFADPKLVDSVNTIVVDAPPVLPEHLQSKIDAALVCDKQDCHNGILIQ